MRFAEWSRQINCLHGLSKTYPLGGIRTWFNRDYLMKLTRRTALAVGTLVLRPITSIKLVLILRGASFDTLQIARLSSVPQSPLPVKNRYVTGRTKRILLLKFRLLGRLFVPNSHNCLSPCLSPLQGGQPICQLLEWIDF